MSSTVEIYSAYKIVFVFFLRPEIIILLSKRQRKVKYSKYRVTLAVIWFRTCAFLHVISVFFTFSLSSDGTICDHKKNKMFFVKA